MPKYHFNLRFGDQSLDDDLGLDLVDRAAALQAARTMVGELFAEAMADRGRHWFGWTVLVVTSDDQPVAAMLVPNEPKS